MFVDALGVTTFNSSAVASLGTLTLVLGDMSSSYAQQAVDLLTPLVIEDVQADAELQSANALVALLDGTLPLFAPPPPPLTESPTMAPSADGGNLSSALSSSSNLSLFGLVASVVVAAAC